MKRDTRAGTRFDGTDRPADEVYTFNGPCWCGVEEGVRHTHAEFLKDVLIAPPPPTREEYDALKRDRDTLEIVVNGLAKARDRLVDQLDEALAALPAAEAPLPMTYCTAVQKQNNVWLACYRPTDHCSQHFDRKENVWWTEEYLDAAEED